MNRVFAAKFLTAAFLSAALVSATAQVQRGRDITDFEVPPAVQPLYQGSWTNNLPLVKAEVEKNPGVIDAHGIWLTAFAAQSGSLPILRYLHDKGADVTTKSAELLAFAVGNGDLEMFEYLVGILPPLSQDEKNELMVTACYLDSLPMVERIHKLGGKADAYVGPFNDMDSGVSAASKHGDPKILPLLLNVLNADPHGRSEDALRQAADHNRADSVLLLLSKGPAPGTPQEAWQKSLDETLILAVEGGEFATGDEGYYDVVKALLRYGANSGAVDENMLMRTRQKYPRVAALLTDKTMSAELQLAP